MFDFNYGLILHLPEVSLPTTNFDSRSLCRYQIVTFTFQTKNEHATMDLSEYSTLAPSAVLFPPLFVCVKISFPFFLRLFVREVFEASQNVSALAFSACNCLAGDVREWRSPQPVRPVTLLTTPSQGLVWLRANSRDVSRN